MNCILLQIFLVVISFSFQVLGVEDYWSSDFDSYWSSDFDSSKKCAEETEVMKLSEKDANQCTSTAIPDTDEEAFASCKQNLAGLVQKKCSYSGLKDAGVLLYLSLIHI